MSDQRGQEVEPTAPLPPVVPGPVGPETPPTRPATSELAVAGAILFAGAVKDILVDCRNNLDHYQGINEGSARRYARASAYLQISDLFEETFGRIDEGWEFR